MVCPAKVNSVGPRAETLIAINLGTGDWGNVAPNTVVVLLLSAAALLLRGTYRWCGRWLGAVAILGSIVFAIGVVSCVGYMTGIPCYAWQSRAPMSFISAICSCVLGLGIVMSAYRYSALDRSGGPQWFCLVVCVGALAINLATAVAYFCKDGRKWNGANAIGLIPMLIVSGMLSTVAAGSTGAKRAAPSLTPSNRRARRCGMPTSQPKPESLMFIRASPSFPGGEF
jgi:hypothetical protein